MPSSPLPTVARRLLATLAGVAIAAFLGVLDYLIGWEHSFPITYLFPIFLVVHWAGKSAGVFTSVACAISWLLADLGSAHPYSRAFTPYWHASVRLFLFLIFTFLLSYLHDVLQRQKQLANTDSLTGIGNARSFYESAKTELERLRRYHHPLTVIYIDVDDFKLINDRHGHSRGDAVLQLIADALQSCIRKTDYVARLAGDEFALLLPETDTEAAAAVAEKLRKALLERMHAQGFSTTFSIGAVTFLDGPDTIDELIRKADECMYSVKHSGKNGIKLAMFGNTIRSTDVRSAR